VKSAGILLYRIRAGALEVLLGHPGGPFWTRRDAGAWSIPKGEINEAEDPLVAARRELLEETGVEVDGPFVPLTPVRQKGGKLVHAWAVEADCDADAIRSNLFAMEWPPKSGKLRQFPEMDRAGWFGMAEARVKILGGQAPLLDELERVVPKGNGTI
jgi:predicted NUDIX family NTP pyrophosphohydrolase